MLDDLDKTSDFLFYHGFDGNLKVEVILGNETVWLSQKSLSELFDVDRSVITKHLQNIFKDGELDETSVSAKNALTATDGKNYMVTFYNLDAIIAVGYRVSSYQATQFRMWATKILKEYLVKGFVIDDERLKQGKNIFGKDYFQELLEKIREIRASERRFYQRITDIYKDCSVDYDSHSPITKAFYASVQNKLIFAVTKETAAEVVRHRANAKAEHMGLKCWKNLKVGGKILKPDVSVSKNYLNKEEITELNAIVNMYLDYAENQARRNKLMKMQDWVLKLNEFLKFNEYDILDNLGVISHDLAKKFAEGQFTKYRVIQDREHKSDFDRVVEGIKNKGELPSELDIINDKKEIKESKPLGDFDKVIKKFLETPPPPKDK